MIRKGFISFVLLVCLCASVRGQTFTFECVGEFISGAECPECTGTTTARLFNGLMIKRSGAYFKNIDCPYIVKQQGSNLVFQEILNPNPETVTVNLLSTGFSTITGFRDSTACMCARQDSAWINDVQTLTSFRFRWNSASVSVGTNPGNGYVAVDNAAPGSAGNVVIDNTTADGVDITAIYDQLRSGDVVRIQEESNGDNWIRYSISGNATDQTGHYSIPVTPIAGVGVEPNNNAYVVVTFFLNSASAGGDPSITNEGILGVAAGGSNDALLTSNTSTANGVTYSGSTTIQVTETTSANGGTILFRADTSVLATVTDAITNLTYSGASSPVTLNSSTGTDVTITAGTSIGLTATGTNLTVTNTDPDQSTTNELQTLANTSDATSHTATLSNSGGSLQLVEGTGIGIATTGTALDGIATLTNTLPDQVVSITGAGISVVTGTYPTFTITSTEVDGSITNEGSLTVGAGGANTSTIISNTSGSTPVTVSGSNTILITEAGSTITVQGDTSLLATLNDINVAANRDDSTWVKYNGSYANKRISDFVYRNAPISIGRRDTTARLYILEKTVPANNIGGALVIQAVSNGDSINYFIRLKSSAKDSTEDFLIGTINSGPISDPGDNTSWWFGQNFLPGGSKQRMSESASGWVIEDKFENSLPIVGLAASTEMHWMYSPERTPDEPDSTSDQVRVISCALDHLGRTNDLGVHADRFYINRFGDVLGYRPAKGPQWAEGDFYNKKWTWYDSLTVIYETPQVNIPFMRFRAADNSRYWKIFEPDASDRLVLNPEGNDLYSFAPNFIFNTQATITTNDAAAIQIGKSTLPAALAVYSSGTGVITMKNSAETTGWTHRVSATEFDIQTPGGNAPLIIHESAPQSSVYVKSDGDIGIGTGGPTARAHLYTTSGATKSMLKLENSTGVNQVFRSNATPEAAITGNPGDLTMANVSSTGKLYVKETGVGNTGWKELLTSGSGALGSGAANQVTYWTGANTIAGSANLTWDGTTHTVTGKGVYAVGNTFGANARGVDMSGNMTSNASSVSLEALRTSVTFANSGAETSNNFRGIYTPTVTGGSTSGVHAGIWTAPTNSSTGITSFYGIFGSVSETSTSGNLANRYGAFLSVDKSSNENTTHSAAGVKGRVRDQSTAGRWSTAYGLESEVTNAQNAYGVYVSTSNSRGTGNSITGLRIGSTVSGSGVVADAVKGVDITFSETSSGSVTTYYGLYCAATAAATTNYLLYNTTDFRNYLNGGLSLGVDVTTAKLFVRGTGSTSATTSFQLEKQDGTDYFVAKDDGMIGIGNNTTLTQPLHVTGNARITGAIYDSGNSPGAAGEVLSSTGTATDWIDPSAETSPAQITADQNNYAGATTGTLNINADASFRSITGIVAPTVNKRLTIHNNGANAILFPTEFSSSTAANRFAFGRDIILFPGKTIEIQYSLAASRWKLVSKAGIYDDVEHLYFNTAFNSPVSLTSGDYDFWDITSAATATTVVPVAGKMRGIAVNTGSSASGVGAVASKETFVLVNNSSSTATWVYGKFVIKTPASLSDGSNDYTLRIGFTTNEGGGGATDGFFFDYNHANVSGNWGCNTTNGGSTQRNNSGTAVAASTVYVLEVVYRPNLTVSYFINGTQVATNDTFLPTADEQLILAEIEKSIGTSQRDLTVYAVQATTAFVK